MVLWYLVRYVTRLNFIVFKYRVVEVLNEIRFCDDACNSAINVYEAYMRSFHVRIRDRVVIGGEQVGVRYDYSAFRVEVFRSAFLVNRACECAVEGIFCYAQCNCVIIVARDNAMGGVLPININYARNAVDVTIFSMWVNSGLAMLITIGCVGYSFFLARYSAA